MDKEVFSKIWNALGFAEKGWLLALAASCWLVSPPTDKAIKSLALDRKHCSCASNEAHLVHTDKKYYLRAC